MAKIGLFFATESGTTKKVAKLIAKELGEEDVALHDVAKAKAEDLHKYDAIIMGMPTMGMGELPEVLDAFLPHLDDVDWSSKRVALFGLGNQEDYPDEFVDAIGIMYKKFKKKGTVPVGAWPTEGYTFTKSKAVVNGAFVGLVIDHDNQEDLTPQRVKAWVGTVKPMLLGIAQAA